MGAACALLLVLLPALLARAEDDELKADVACEARPGPGKVRCSVRVRAHGTAARLAWCDALVVSAPAMAPPLRTRIARGDALRIAPDEQELALALAAIREGAGVLKVRVRAVVCRLEAEGCRAQVVEASTRVVVGIPRDGGEGSD